jgi:hypothetical protein
MRAVNKRDFPPDACDTILAVNAAELLELITLQNVNASTATRHLDGSLAVS